MVSPWSTNAVEITQTMGIKGIIRIEEFMHVDSNFKAYDPMISQKYDGLDQEVFSVNIKPAPVLEIKDIAAFNIEEGLSLNSDEVHYLEGLAKNWKGILQILKYSGFHR